MTQSNEIFRPGAIENVLIRIGDTINGDYTGSISNVALEEDIPFTGVNALLLRLDEALDTIGFLEPTVALRSFIRHRPSNSTLPEGTQVMADKATPKKTGAKNKASFVVQIRYRENATWQGQVQWVEKGEVRTFRSALELIKLIDGVVSDEDMK